MNGTQITNTPIDNIPSCQFDESTLDSYDISIHETTLVSATPKSLAPKPILLHLPCNDTTIPSLGIDLLLTLPVITYIHPTSPLLNILHVGDVLLELDGRKSTQMEFGELNGWLNGNTTREYGGALKESRADRTILFLPGRNSPYNPECERYTPDGLSKHSSIVKPCQLYDTHDGVVDCDDQMETGTSNSNHVDSHDHSDAVEQVVDTIAMNDVETSETQSSVVDCDDQMETGTSNSNHVDSHVQLDAVEQVVDTITMKDEAVDMQSCPTESTSKCTLYLDEEESSSQEQSESESSSPLEIGVSIESPTVTSSEVDVQNTQIQKVEKEKGDPATPSTTANTYKSSDGSESSPTSSCENIITQQFPTIFIAPNLQNSSGETNARTQTSSPLMVCKRPSSQSSVSISEDSNELEPIYPQVLFRSSSDEKSTQSRKESPELNDTSGASSNSSKTSTIESLDRIAEICEPVLQKMSVNDVTAEVQSQHQREQEDVVESTLISEAQDVIESKSIIEENEFSSPPITTKRNSTVEECTNKETAPQEDEQDWEVLQQKKRNRPAPEFDTIAVDLGCDEDISTIFGGKYNAKLHSTKARAEDNLICYLETGNYDPNTLSQLQLHGVNIQTGLQQELQARKLELEKQDYEMKEARLQMLKKKHRIIEGIFAVFIVVSVVVFIGVLFAVLYGK